MLARVSGIKKISSPLSQCCFFLKKNLLKMTLLGILDPSNIFLFKIETNIVVGGRGGLDSWGGGDL